MTAIETLGQKGHQFSNWANTHSCRPELYFEPEHVDEIKQIVGLARARSKKVKVCGFGHSPSDIACTHDYLINMKHLNKVLMIDREKCVVKVEGGISIATINETLANNGLALSVQGSISNLTLAGAISTGTHGTGINYGTIASYVLELELLTVAGEVLTLSRTQDQQMFLLSLIGLGSLGIILSITVQCEPEFKLHQKQYTVKLRDLLENLDVHLKASDHFRFMYYPYTDDCIVYHMTRTDKPVQNKSSWFWDKVVGYHLFEFLFWISTFMPSLVPRLNRFHLRLNSGHQELIDRGDKVFNFDCLFKQYVMEWAIPREKTAVALYELKAWIDNSPFKVHFPIEVRFVKEDDIGLSPAFHTNACYINIIMYRPYNKEVPHNEYWDAFADIMMKAGGKPHWAKDHKLNAEHFREMYPKWQDFCRIRQQLDPTGMFLNENLKKVFFGSKL